MGINVMRTKAWFLRILLISFSILIVSCQISTDSSGGNNNDNNNTTTSITNIRGNGTYALYLTDAGNVFSAYLQFSSTGTTIVNYKVGGLSNIRKIAAAPANTGSGQYEGIALDKDGKIFTINMNFTTGKPDSALLFTQMSSFGSSLITDIAAGGDGTTIFFLGLDTSGRVWGWGNNGSAFYGIYSGTTPQLINGLSNITAISAGVNQALALNSSGMVYNWGIISRQNDEKYSTPIVNIGASPASLIDAGDNYNVAKRTDGSVYVWGHLMDGVIPGITFPSAISAGAETYYNPMFLKSDGSIVKTSFSMVDGSPQAAEPVTELSSYTFSMFDISSRAFFITSDGKLVVQSSSGTVPYSLNTPLK